MNQMIRLTALPFDTATARTLAGRNDPDTGTIVITVRPDTRRAGWLARDLLAAVGVRHDVTGHSRRDSDDRQLASVWLAAYGIDDLLVVGVETLPPDLVDELVDVTSLAGTTLWLVADHTLPQRLTDTLEDWPVTPWPPEQFAAAWLTPTPADSADVDVPAAAAQAAALPSVVPYADFTTFRSACRSLLDAHEFAAVDGRYQQQLADAGTALDAGKDVLDVLRDAVERSCSATETTIVVRAVQAAAFVRGVHVRIDLAALVAHDDHVPAAAASDPHVSQALRAYRHPHRQTICILTMLGMPPADQLAATISGLAGDASTLTVGTLTWDIPAVARPALRALATTRAAAGAGPDDVLVADLDGGVVTDRTIARIVATVPRELAFRVDVGQVERTRPAAHVWARRRGIRTAELVV